MSRLSSNRVGFKLGIFGCSLAFLAVQPVRAATVISVGDGDTIRVLENSSPLTIRIACIDAPESSQAPYGTQSAKALKALLPVGSTVTILVHAKKDRYGRMVAEVVSQKGNIGKVLVRQGNAFVYRDYLSTCEADQYLLLERKASLSGLGIWSVGTQGIERPWEFRRRSKSTGQGGRRRYRCSEISSWSHAQLLLRQGHYYLDRDKDGEACEGLR